MNESNRPVVLSVASAIDIYSIGGGNTIAVRFQAPDGREIAVLVPRKAFVDLQTRLTEMLAQPLPRERDRN